MPAMFHCLHFSQRLTVRAWRGRRSCKFKALKVRPTLKRGHGLRNELARQEEDRRCRERRGKIRAKEVRRELKQESEKEGI